MKTAWVYNGKLAV